MKYEMSLRRAMEILLVSSLKDIRGSGLGYRSTTDKWREEVRKARHRVKQHLYEWYVKPNPLE